MTEEREATMQFVPETRIPIRCDHCGKDRTRLDDIKLIACGCISSRWIKLRNVAPALVAALEQGASDDRSAAGSN